MSTVKTRLARLERNRREKVEARYHVVAQRLLGLLSDEELRGLTEGLQADLEGTWDDLEGEIQELAWVAYERIEAEATPEEWAVLKAGY